MSNKNQCTNILEITDLSKSFPGVQALNKVDFSICKGEIHGLIGENGAGKSTLIKIISGALKRDSGTILYEHSNYTANNSTEALQKGIATVYQELSLCQNMSVSENLLINRHPKKGFTIDFKSLYKKTIEYLEQFGLQISPNEIVQSLPLSTRAQIEILRALSYNPKLLILDEPTGALSAHQAKKLFELLNNLKNQGASILYISHNINEILELCDRITVLRDGIRVNTFNSNEVTEEKLASQMVGRNLNTLYPDRNSIFPSEVVLSVKNLSDGELFSNISFDVRKGEILGVAGLVGSGRTELALTIFGYRNIVSGEILINGKPVIIKKPKDAIRNRIAYLPEDRHLLGLFLSFNMANNLLSNNLERFSCRSFIDNKKLVSSTRYYIKYLQIKASGPDQIVGLLSGGNQQKTLLAKWIGVNPEVLIIDEPIRGIDVGTKKAVHELLRELANKGMSIIMISSELPEILGMSDRIMIMDRKCIIDITKNDHSVTEEYIMNTIVNFKKGKNNFEKSKSI